MLHSATMSNARTAYFGYGSLVNRETLRTTYIETHRAVLKDWRRHWQSREHSNSSTGNRDIALLSVHRHIGYEISGLLIIDDRKNLEAVDRREEHYDRERIPLSGIEIEPANVQAALPEELYVYVARKPSDMPCDCKLLQSYLDAVMAGYLREFGEAGLNEFIQTTVGFNRSIICDRASPRYPRSIELTGNLSRYFDKLLDEAGARFY
jgi:hypothetical protein